MKLQASPKRLLTHEATSAVLVFVVGFVFLFCLEDRMREHAHGGLYFHQWTSEKMMQTVSVLALREEPLKSLFYLHVQPPVFDAIRAALVSFWPDVDGETLIRNIDRALYLVWNFFYALMGMLIFLWLSKLTNRLVGLMAVAACWLHPALIFFATLLEGTIISAFGFLWACFELWLLGSTKEADRRGSVIRLSLAVVFMFLTRSVFQWPVLVVFVVSLVLTRVDWKTIALFVSMTGTVMGAYTLKQYLLFDITYTSSLAGYNCCKSIGGCGEVERPSKETIEQWKAGDPQASAALVLRQRRTLHGANYNSLRFLNRGKMQLEKYKVLVKEKELGELYDDYKLNFEIFLRPSSRYTEHVIVDRLPWRDWYDKALSHTSLIVLLSSAILIWLINGGYKTPLRGIGFMLPVLFTAAVTIIFERGENMRFKFFIEPVLWVFISSQAAGIVTMVQRLVGAPRG